MTIINHDVNKEAGTSRNNGIDYIFENNLETETTGDIIEYNI